MANNELNNLEAFTIIPSVLWRLLRRLRGMPPPAISREMALRFALEEMERRGESLMDEDPELKHRGPAVEEGLQTWTVYLEPDFYRNCRKVEVDNQSGKIKAYYDAPEC